MTQEEAKVMWPIIKRWSEGETLEYSIKSYPNDFSTGNGSLAFSEPPHCYRIKGQPKYRPWNYDDNIVGKIIRRKNDSFTTIILWADIAMCGDKRDNMSYEWLFQECIQLDGTPCGVLIS